MTSPETPPSALHSDLDLTFSEAGTGRPALILHGGGGPFTVAGIFDYLAGSMHAIAPTLPGWNGTARPDRVTGIGDYALILLQYLEANDLRDVLVVGSSLGGWVGAEMAIRDAVGRISGLVLIDAVGVAITGETIRDFFALDARGVADYSFHDADRFYVDPATVPAERAARQQANLATMRVVAGDPYMHDPALLDRLGQVRIPTLGIWGDSDRIVSPAYGAAYVAGFPHGRFEIVRNAGHLPQIEQPAATLTLIDDFVRREGR